MKYFYSIYGKPKKTTEPDEISDVFLEWVETRNWDERVNVCKHQFVTSLDKSLRKLEKYINTQPEPDLKEYGRRPSYYVEIPQHDVMQTAFLHELETSKFEKWHILLPLDKVFSYLKRTTEAKKLKKIGMSEYCGDDQNHKFDLEQNWEAIHLHFGKNILEEAITPFFHETPEVTQTIASFLCGILQCRIFIGNWPEDKNGYRKDLIVMKSLWTLDVDIFSNEPVYNFKFSHKKSRQFLEQCGYNKSENENDFLVYMTYVISLLQKYGFTRQCSFPDWHESLMTNESFSVFE